LEVNSKQFSGSWAVILGGSSGFGLATVRKLAAHGMNIALLYREMASTEKVVKLELGQIEKEFDAKILSFNLNALSEEGQQTFIREFKKLVGAQNVFVY